MYTDENISGRNYRKLMEFAFEHSDSVLMVYRESSAWCNTAQLLEIRERLKPYLIETRSNASVSPENPFFEWPGTRVAYCNPFNPPENYHDPDGFIYVDTYALSDEVKEFILSVDGIFNWWPGENPEDLAFFKDGKCWMFSTAHEHSLGFSDHIPELRELLHSMHVMFGM